ncbi:hypothetical protein EDD92_4490 [Streptomyces sp. TLI_185]|nr:hypothetical protein EDD92_4490 [Streptomyces sp. TLI_185]
MGWCRADFLAPAAPTRPIPRGCRPFDPTRGSAPAPLAGLPPDPSSALRPRTPFRGCPRTPIGLNGLVLKRRTGWRARPDATATTPPTPNTRQAGVHRPSLRRPHPHGRAGDRDGKPRPPNTSQAEWHCPALRQPRSPGPERRTGTGRRPALRPTRPTAASAPNATPDGVHEAPLRRTPPPACGARNGKDVPGLRSTGRRPGPPPRGSGGRFRRCSCPLSAGGVGA